MKRKNQRKSLSWFLAFCMAFNFLLAQNIAVVSAGNKVKLNVKGTKTLKTGISYQLKVKSLPKKAKKLKYKWTSSDKKVASVSGKGRVTAKRTGTAKITCKITYQLKNGRKTTKKTQAANCKIKVISAAVPTQKPAPSENPTPSQEPTPTETPASSALPTNTPEATETPTETSKPEVNEIVKKMGVGINLGNTMDSYWLDYNNKTGGCQFIGNNTPQDYEQCWGAIVTTQETIAGMRSAGFSTVRIPVYWGNMMKDDGQFIINEEYIKRIKEIVDYCMKSDLYVVMNVHHYDEFLVKNYSRSEVLQLIEKIWTQIAVYFRNYSERLVFEGFNEHVGTQREGDNYTEDEMYDYVNEMNQAFVDTVRKTGGNNGQRFLIASGWWTNIDKTSDSRFKMPVDTVADRLMVSIHYIDNGVFWGKKIGSQEWLDYSMAQCELMKKAFIDKGVPVFVGECTAIYGKEYFAENAIYQDSSKCLSLLLNMAVDYGFLPVLWDVNDNFYSRTNYNIKSESDQKVIIEISEKIKAK